MRRGIVAVLAALLLGVAADAAAQAFRPFTIRDIRVEGLQRTEPGTVFSYLPVKVGETMDEEKAQSALRALYATGFFQDVRLEVDNDVLVVFVQERPAIAQIDFSGMKEFEPENVRKILRELGMAEGRIFDRSVLESTEQEIKRQYLSKGLYAATVQSTVTPLERNRVGISIAVTEGEVAKIRGINIVGASAYKESEIVDLFTLRTPGWLTWYTKLDRYSRERLASDLETVRAFYQNQGYLDFGIDSTQVSITPDRRDIYITVNIVEGDKYTVSDVRLSGQTVVPQKELEALIRLKPGDIFSREKLISSTKAIADRLGNEGYAFANANAIPEVNKEKRTVSFNIVVDPARRVYVRRVDVAGNTRTRDEVVRREMRQLEGAYYDASKIQLSRRRIDRTGYFSDVSVDTLPVEGRSDQVDVVYSLRERSTGALLFGIGFSSTEKIALNASISQSNVFGTGNYLSANVNSGTVNKVYSLSYMNPYYTVDGVSRGFDVYKRKVDASRLSIAPFATDAYGGGVKFGYPLSETRSIDFGLAAESQELTTFATSPVQYRNFVAQFGNSYTYLSGTAGLANDSRDSILVPTSGSLARVTTEVAQGDLQYAKLGYQHQYYYPLSSRYTFLLGAEIGYAEGLGDKPLPFFKNYYAGGPGSVRGYSSYSLGPRDATGLALGGNRKLSLNSEILFPMPGADQDRSLRLSAFLDGGNVFLNRYQPRDMRYSAGIGFFWSSPFGPLRLSWAFPLNRQPTDHVQQLQFAFGTGF